MKIEVDRSKCQGVGMCESVAPEIFEVDDGGELVLHGADSVSENDRQAVEDAVEACPTQALSVGE